MNSRGTKKHAFDKRSLRVRALSGFLALAFFALPAAFAQPALEVPQQRLLPPADATTAPAAAPDPTAAPTEDTEASYLLQPGDELSVIDPSMGTDGPFTTVVPVLPDGTVSIYPVGVLTAKGKTVKALTQEVREKAAAFIVNPSIIISLSRMRPVDVYVLGNVISPGLYSVEVDRAGRERSQALSTMSAPAVPLPGRFTGGPLTNLMASPSPVRATSPASLTVLTAIQMAGGVRENADVRRIVVRRQGSPPKVVDLWAMIAEGEADQDFPLRAGDVIVVPKGGPAYDAEMLGAAANRRRAVRVFGAVRNPGIYELTPRDDLISIISRAGGFVETAKTSHAILSRQDRSGKIQTFKLSIKRSVRDSRSEGRMPVMPGDVVQVQYSLVKQTAPRALTIAGTFLSAFFILYFSRIIVDQSQPQTTTSVSTGGTTGSTSSTTSSTASSTSTSTQ